VTNEQQVVAYLNALFQHSSGWVEVNNDKLQQG